MKISVITPFCNTDIDLFRETVKCIEKMSISRSDYEWIVVFHNCTDSSREEAMRLIEKTDIAARCFELKDNNRTPSAPRNYGISKAAGEYIYFLDSDDRVDAEFLSKALREADDTSAEVVIAGADRIVLGDDIMPLPMNLMIYSRNGVYRIDNEKYLSDCNGIKIRRNREILGKLLYGAPVFLATKIIRRSLLIEHNILFDIRLRMMEDICFEAAVYSAAERISILTDTVAYTYVQNGLSQMQSLIEKGSFSTDVILDPLKAIVSICEQEDIDYNLFLWSVYEMLGALSLKNILDKGIKGELVHRTEIYRKKLKMIPFVGTGRNAEADNMSIMAEAFTETGVYEHMGSSVTLQKLVEKTRKFGNARAVSMSDGSLSYDSLHKNSDAVAAYLCHMEIHCGERIGIYMDKGKDAFCALFGIIKAGAAFVVLSKNNSESRNRYIIDNSKTEIIINDENYGDIVSRYYGKGYTAAKSCPNDLITIEYTSGSEGIPKGVAFTNRNFTSSLMPYKGNLKNVSQSGKSNTYIMHMGLEFLFGLLVTFEALLYGKHLCVLKDINEINSEFLRSILKDNDTVASMDAVPSVAAQWFSNPEVNKLFKYCHFMLYGGEGVKAEQIVQTRKYLAKDSEVFHGYATTETGPCCYEDADPDNLSSGIPQSDVSVSILDEDLNPVPNGEKGRICIKGYRVASGYVGNADSTYFVRGRDGINTFISGDSGYLDHEGRLHVCGRMDRMLKINGVRVEPAEIEGAAMNNPFIDMAAYKVFDTDDGSVTSLFIHCTDDITESKVRRYLLEHLPRYMMPDMIIPVSEIPLTDRGKLDYKALMLPEIRSGNAKENNTPESEIITNVFKEVLNKEDISGRDNFFALGGDSLKAILLTEKLRKHGIIATVRDIFIYPTPDALSEIAVKEFGEDEKADENDNVITNDSDTVLETFGIVRGFYFLPEEYREAYRYNLRIQFETVSQIDEKYLKNRIASMQRMHPVLRSRFEADGSDRSKAMQIIGTDYPEAFFVKDISYMESERRSSFIRNFWKIMDEMDCCFYVASFKIRNGNYVVLMKTSHMIADAWGSNILLKELSGNVSVSQSGDDGYINFQKKMIEKRKHSEDAIAYFREYLRDAKPACLETMGGIVAAGTPVISEKIHITHECVQKLLKLSISRGLSFNNYVQYMYGKALMETLEQESAIYICSFSGRTDENINIVANYFTTLPVCIQKDMSPQEFQNHIIDLQEYAYLDSDYIGKELRMPFRALGCVDGINFNLFDGALEGEHTVSAKEIVWSGIKGNRAYADGKDVVIEIGHYADREKDVIYAALKQCLEKMIEETCEI